MKINNSSNIQDIAKLKELQNTANPAPKTKSPSKQMDTVSISNESILLNEASKLFKAVGEHQKSKVEQAKNHQVNAPSKLYGSFKMKESVETFQHREVEGIMTLLKEGLESGSEEALQKIGEKFGKGFSLTAGDLDNLVQWMNNQK